MNRRCLSRFVLAPGIHVAFRRRRRRRDSQRNCESRLRHFSHMSLRICRWLRTNLLLAWNPHHWVFFTVSRYSATDRRMPLLADSSIAARTT